jgi:aspartyl protease family protein
MKKQIIVFIIFISSIAFDLNAQTIFYNEDGLKVNKTDATSYRIYTLDKTAKKGTFKEFNMQNILLKESGFLKFDFTDKSKQILNNKYIEYRNDSIFRINYKNNLPINQMDVYDKKNRLIQIVPVKNGKIIYDDDVIDYNYFEDSKKNEYYTVQGKFDGDVFFGKVTLFYESFIKTYFFNGEDFSLVNKNECFAYNFLNYGDKNKSDLLSFEDNFNCGKNFNWALFLISKEIKQDLDFVNIKNNQLLLQVDEDETATDFRLLNDTPIKIENNDFDLRVNILSQEKCISGITINNKNYLTNSYTDQYRIGLSKDLGVIILEKMIDEIYVLEKSINISDLLKDSNELRILKEDRELKIILNNTLVFTDSNYSYVGESIGLYCFGKKGVFTYFDDFKLKIKVIENNMQAIKIKKEGNINKIPISLNDVINTDFIIDTGASNVSITPDLALLLIKSGTINSEDWLKDKYYQFADGSIAKSKTFKIKKLKIGTKYLYNVECSISNNLQAPLLLGQNVLNRFGKVIIDNEKQMLFLE